jgi:hypothetical protein
VIVSSHASWPKKKGASLTRSWEMIDQSVGHTFGLWSKYMTRWESIFNQVTWRKITGY